MGSLKVLKNATTSTKDTKKTTQNQIDWNYSQTVAMLAHSVQGKINGKKIKLKQNVLFQ